MSTKKKLVVPIVFDAFHYYTEKPLLSWVFEMYSNYCVNNNMPLIAQENFFNQEINALNETYEKPNENIKEIGSGMNDNRPKLMKILKDAKATKLIVEHKDRLARFGLNYIQKLLELDNRKIEIINPQTNDEDDLMQDFVSIITSFVARLYGRRRSRRLTEKIIKGIVNEDTKSI